METINMIFENYGSERLGRIFKNYWILLILLKHVMFSFFMVEPPIKNYFPGESDKNVQEMAINDKKEPIVNLDLVMLLITLAHLNSNVQMEEPITN